MKRIAAVFISVLCAFCMLGCSKDSEGDIKDAETLSDIDENPASSVVMTSAQADSLANTVSVKLYYKTVDESFIVAETALMDFSQRDKKVSLLASDILAKLLDGPANLTVLSSVIPEGTEINEVGLKSGTLNIDVNKTFIDGISSDEELAELVVSSVVNTVTELKEVKRVEFTCEGEEIGTLACGFEFKTFERDMSLVRSDAETSAVTGDPYAENLYEDVSLE